MFSRIGFGTPINEEILLYWEKSGHVEDGMLFFDGENHDISHVLYDGEALDEQPTHWMPKPTVDEN